MTRRLVLSLDLNENDLDALHALLDNPAVVAKAVASLDQREQVRIIDVLAQMACSLDEAINK
ncbi:hypothetical protein [Stutzerimonas nitrititolerans]|uniref:hypothetical protein n=1 Tax=Stutzerimonas nitrititolerans TaxID=2482751 RepID=UPI00289B9175|nr:hypothetical protein [Stutzerimonas nitrititolerans]